ncbi:MAG: hypothetical protein ABSG68_20955 [Thermoguttaceae bacterium]|jgi:NAD(P)-dependent dehydrogenase (short-subunit alcohol dehydrogenase family)
MTNESLRVAVTGVSRGLGRAMAEEFAARGHIVCGYARGSEAANYPGAESWARRAVPFLLSLGPAHNGQPREVPNGEAGG